MKTWESESFTCINPIEKTSELLLHATLRNRQAYKIDRPVITQLLTFTTFTPSASVYMEFGKPLIFQFSTRYQWRKLTKKEMHLIQHNYYYSLIQAEALVIPGDEIKMIILNYRAFLSSFTDSTYGGGGEKKTKPPTNSLLQRVIQRKKNYKTP